MGIQQVWCFVTTHGDEDRGDLFDSKATSLPIQNVSLFIVIHLIHLPIIYF